MIVGLSPKEMGEAIIRNLTAKTGRGFEQWVEITRNQGPESTAQKREWLKRKYGLGHVTAGLVAAAASGKENVYSSPDRLVLHLFSGGNAHLRSLYDEIINTVEKLGDDVRVIPCKTYVGISRKRQFAVVKPVPAGHIEIGLALGHAPVEGRLGIARSMGVSERITRCVSVFSKRDLNGELRAWLKQAYDANA
jgi:hypothetical protein